MRIHVLPTALLLCATFSALAAQEDAEIIQDRERAQRQIRDFEHSLAQLGVQGRLRCPEVIELIQDSPDYSFGAICELSVGTARKTVMLCDDTMIGKFTIKTSGFSMDRESLVHFTRENCPGGG